MQFGSVINQVLAESAGPSMPEVGMGGSICGWSDRHAVSVIGVYHHGRRVVVQRDKAIRVDSNGMSDAQDYRYEADPQGAKSEWSLRQNGQWKQVGSSGRGSVLVLGRRDEHYDYSF
jgi:hypothetical protein